MVAFNYSMLDKWKSSGYRYILVLPREKYGVLRPLVEDKPVKKGYIIEFSEVRLLQMVEEYFVTKEKDAFVRSTSAALVSAWS